MKRLHNMRGAALVEYALIWPVIMLLLLGSLEMFRLMAIKQSLRTGLSEALPCVAARLDSATGCDPEGWVQMVVDRNPLTINRADVSLTASSEAGNLQYGQIFSVVAEATVELGFLYPFEGGPTITLQEERVTFYTADPSYYGMWWETPMPIGPGALP